MKIFLATLLLLMLTPWCLATPADDHAATETRDQWQIGGQPVTLDDQGFLSRQAAEPQGRYHVVNVQKRFPHPVDLSEYPVVRLRLKIVAPRHAQAHLRITLYSRDAERGQGHIYGRILPADARGQWQDYLLNLADDPARLGGNRLFDPKQVTSLRAAVVCQDADERIDLTIGSLTFETPQEQDVAIRRQLTSLGNRAMAVAGRIQTPPIIDGSLDDDAWKHAVVLSDFHTNQGTPAAEPTEVRLLHDDQWLYLGVRAHAAVLDPVHNLLTEFRETVTEPQGPVYNDDCIEFFFSDGQDRYGHIIVNTHTFFARTLSHGTAAAWSPPIQKQARKYIGSARSGDGGFYTIELAIPLEAIRPFASAQGLLTFNVARQNKHQKELSNWIRASSFHSMERYATLHLSEYLPGLSLPALEPVHNKPTLIYELGPSERPSRLQAAIQILHGPQRDDLKIIPLVAGRHHHTIDHASGNFQYSLLLIEGEKILYRSPIGSVGAGQAVAYGTLEEGAMPIDADIRINGAAIDANGSLPLVQGKNILTIATARPWPLKVQLGDGQAVTLDDTWKFATDEHRHWNTFQYDDTAWPSYSAADTMDAQRLFLRKTLLAEVSRFYPLLNEEHALRAPAGAVQPFSWIVTGIPQEELRDTRFYLEVPEGLSFAGASAQSTHPAQWDAPRCQWEKKETLLIEGVPYTRYEIRYRGNVQDQPGVVRHVLPEKITASDLIVLALQPDRDRSGQSLRCYYYMTAHGGTYTEKKRHFSVEVLPALGEAGPQKLRMLTWFSFRHMDDIDLQKRIYQEHTRAGFNIANSRSGHGQIIRTTGMRYCSRFNFERHGFDPAPVLAKYPQVSFISYLGHKRPHQVPFHHIVHHPELRADLAAAFARYLEERQPDIVDWDFEFDPITGLYASYDPDTLAAFQERHGITEPLTPAVIREKYAREWIPFMNELTAEVFRFLREVAQPRGIEIDVYSGYPSNYTRDHYGIDYDLVLPHVDFAMMGYGRPLEQIAEIKRLSEKYDRPVLFGICARPYFFYQIAPQSPITPALVLRRVIDSGHGAMYWGHYCSDGELLHAFSEINRMLHRYEDYMLEGERIDATGIAQVTGLTRDDLAAYRWQGRILLLALNPKSSAAQISIRLSDIAASEAEEFYSAGKIELRDQTLNFSLDEGRVAAFLIP